MERTANKHSLARTALAFSLTLGIAISSTPAQATVAQSPLILGGGGVPGSLALTPSVEWPTMLSVANVGNYSNSRTYVGYFDSFKCYIYNITNEWFEPSQKTSNRQCTGEYEWSGNFLNWAATPTIDPFRSALTGGHRYKDEVSLTVLQKARHDGQNTAGNRYNNTMPVDQISGAMPLHMSSDAWPAVNIRLSGLQNKIRISAWTDKIDITDGSGQLVDIKDTRATQTKFYWINGKLKRATDIGSDKKTPTKSVYEFYARVQVCKPGLLEKNCKQYGTNYKPEGLLQQYSDTLNYSVFSYLNDSSVTRDGGVLRANQKSIAPIYRARNSSSATANPQKEWDPNTGIFVKNPDNITSALGETISHSGVINYINMAGQLNTHSYKSYDPVSELYYTAIRYFRNIGHVPAYSSGASSDKNKWVDGFPVITDWDDPIQYSCQKNVILGIGDTNTHRDKNLPGTTGTTDEPSKPTEVSSDDTINVETVTQTIASLEGITINNANFRGADHNSAYIAGLAYDSNINDIRPNIAGKQTISTYWVDVMENQVLKGKSQNQYWLATKYGGFKVPTSYTSGTALQESWWHTTGDMLALGTAGNAGTEKRPDNFFVASDAEKMVAGLKKAFAQISQEVSGTTSSLATNSTRLATDTAVFQSLLDSKYWSGDLMAKTVASNGTVSSDASWSAAGKLGVSPTVSGRKIFTATTPAEVSGGALLSTTGVNFTWTGGISDAQKALLQTAAELTANDVATAEKRLNFLRGDRSLEKTNDDLTKPFRQRASRLGDIVNSDPQYTHKEDYGYSRLIGDSWSTARTAYAAFVAGKASRTPLVVVGANDGMLHGFNASVAVAGNGGQELFAFIPNSVFANLKDLSDPAYAHKYYVDGTPRISDAWINNAWKTLVAGTTGAGGKSVFVLDISDPSNMASSKFLWEFSHPDMGYTIGQPAIVALPNGEFSVVVTSGYHDTARTEAKVWFLNAANGSVLQTVTLNTAGDLAAPLLADTNGDQVADRLYVGDSLGKLWRVDMAGATASSWGIPTSLSSGPLFTAIKDGTAQPITVQPSSAFNEKGEHMVFFGTGTYIRTGDNEIPATNRPIQSFYGIIDKGLSVARSELLQQSILKEVNVNDVRGRSVSQNNLSTQKGWYLDLAWTAGEGATGAQGERVISKATLRTDRVTFTTMTPSSDPCASGGTSWIMALNLSSGGRLNYVYFDTNKDGDLDSDDTIADGDDDLPISGISDPDDGVVKGAAPLYRWLCYAGSAGAAPQCIKVAGSQRYGRHSWQEIR